MYTLHIANKNYSSWSLRPWVLMQTLNIPFTESVHKFEERGNWKAYREFSPTGKVPCLHDVSTEKTVVWDSLAIVEYLAESHKEVWPSDKSARTWARCAAAEMHSSFQSLRGSCNMNCGLRVELKELDPGLQRDIARIDELWCEGLKKFGGPFLAGRHFTAVDAFFAPVVFRVQTYHLPLSDTAKNYCALMLELPAMKRWYEAALAETWRVDAYDKNALLIGKVKQDLRQS